jgi:regulator of protease activity HflC (stomatin/prohibitin superfamily)
MRETNFVESLDLAQRFMKLIAVVVFIGFAALLAWIFFLVIVPAGNVGVLNTFGVVSDSELPPGLHFKLPWQGVALMTVKTMELKETADTPSDEGLTVTLDTSILYRIQADKASDIYKTIGIDYETVVIEPTFRSVVRGVTASYDAKSLYTSERSVIADKIFQELEPRLRERGVVLESVLMRSIKMPFSVQQGIEAKLVAEQEAQRMEFVLQKEDKEAERKVIEAEGIAKSQLIIDKSVNDPRLKAWAS